MNEAPIMRAALATYGVARVAGMHTTADVGVHTLEAADLMPGRRRRRRRVTELSR